MDHNTANKLVDLHNAKKALVEVFVNHIGAYDYECTDELDVVEISDRFFDINDIVTALSLEIDPDTIFDWYDQILDHYEKGKIINLKSWNMGLRYK